MPQIILLHYSTPVVELTRLRSLCLGWHLAAAGWPRLRLHLSSQAAHAGDARCHLPRSRTAPSKCCAEPLGRVALVRKPWRHGRETYRCKLP
jgi:hypothetical protein